MVVPAGMPGPLTSMPTARPVVFCTVTRASPGKSGSEVPVLVGIATRVPSRAKLSVAPKLMSWVAVFPTVGLLSVTLPVVVFTANTVLPAGMPVPEAVMPTVSVAARAGVMKKSTALFPTPVRK